MTLDVSLVLNAPAGPLELQNPAGGYELHADSFAQRAVTWRQQDVEGMWLEGTYTSSAVRANVTEAVVVWVEGADPDELNNRIDALVNGIQQLRYTFDLTIGNSKETWTCMPADYTIEASQPLRFATMATVRATVPRLPTLTRVKVA